MIRLLAFSVIFLGQCKNNTTNKHISETKSSASRDSFAELAEDLNEENLQRLEEENKIALFLMASDDDAEKIRAKMSSEHPNSAYELVKLNPTELKEAQKQKDRHFLITKNLKQEVKQSSLGMSDDSDDTMNAVLGAGVAVGFVALGGALIANIWGIKRKPMPTVLKKVDVPIKESPALDKLKKAPPSPELSRVLNLESLSRFIATETGKPVQKPLKIIKWDPAGIPSGHWGELIKETYAIYGENLTRKTEANLFYESRNKLGALANTSQVNITYNGLSAFAEQHFQASKVHIMQRRGIFARGYDGKSYEEALKFITEQGRAGGIQGKAKTWFKSEDMQPWFDKNFDVMHDIVIARLKQDPNTIAAWITAPRGIFIEETSKFGDSKYGWGTDGRGLNFLGSLLTIARERFFKENNFNRTLPFRFDNPAHVEKLRGWLHNLSSI